MHATPSDTQVPYIFTSESVSEGHPDKVCDFIADSILDAYLTEDPVERRFRVRSCNPILPNRRLWTHRRGFGLKRALLWAEIPYRSSPLSP